MKKLLFPLLAFLALPILTMDQKDSDKDYDYEVNSQAIMPAPAQVTKVIWNSPQWQMEVDCALAWASSAGNTQKVIQLLHDEGANPNALKSEPPYMIAEPPFMTALSRHHTETCKILIDAGADPLKRNIWGESPYFRAILYHNNEDTFQLLLDAGVDDQALSDLSKINFQMEQFGGSHSSRKYFARYVEKIVEKYLADKKDLTETDDAKMTVLHYAALCQLTESCKKLIENGADANTQNVRKETPLHFATYGENSEELCKLLIDAGADMNNVATNIRTWPVIPLCCAAQQKNPAAFELLCAHGADAYAGSSINRLACFHPHLLSSFVFAPELNNLDPARSKILHLLLCFSRIQPQLPRDVQQVLIASCEAKNLGALMVSRKLHGKPIPEIARSITTEVLYNYTLGQLKKELILAKERNPSFDVVSASMFFEEKHGTDIRKTVIARLAQPKLLCNNPAQIAGLSLDKN